ncbi:MAG: Bug family tripartite tricarboxylate transporter substrate binding protein [Burkholderiales bacterium]
MKIGLLLSLTGALLGGVWSPAMGQAFPVKPIRIIVSTSPGGLTDLISRNSGQGVTESTGQPVVVEYRPGAGTLIGFQACEKAPPDGYTVCVTTPESLVYNPLLFSKLPYDAENGFVPVTNLFRGAGGVIVAHPSAPNGSFADVIVFARANPGALNYATWGSGSVPGIMLGWINHANGVNITPVPYKGAGPSLPAIVAGQVHLTYSAIGLVQQHVNAGKLRLLAVAGKERSPFVPGTPSLGDFNSDPGLNSYFAMFAPAKTPMPIVERLAAEFGKAVHSERIKELLKTQALIPVGNTPSEFAAFLKEDKVNAARIFKAIGIRPGETPPTSQ